MRCARMRSLMLLDYYSRRYAARDAVRVADATFAP